MWKGYRYLLEIDMSVRLFVCPFVFPSVNTDISDIYWVTGNPYITFRLIDSPILLYANFEWVCTAFSLHLTSLCTHLEPSACAPEAPGTPGAHALGAPSCCDINC